MNLEGTNSSIAKGEGEILLWNIKIYGTYMGLLYTIFYLQSKVTRHMMRQVHMTNNQEEKTNKIADDSHN